jgi:hypothetical protein
MQEYVEVGGLRVTQQVLEDMCAHLAAHGCAFVPDGHAPDLGRFGPYDGVTVSSPEEYVYLLCENPDLNRGFRERFIDPPRSPLTASPTGVLYGAGFPTVTVMQAPQRARNLPPIAAWAGGYRGTLTPWLWVTGGTETGRTAALADVALTAGRAMAEGEAPTGQIIYRRAHDLCEEVNSALGYGEVGHDTKRGVMEPYKTCSLLLLDGLGEERARATELDTLHEILGERWRNGRPTAMASQLRLAQWVGRHARTNQPKAQDMAGKIVGAMCEYGQGLDREAMRAAVKASTVDLDRD